QGQPFPTAVIPGLVPGAYDHMARRRRRGAAVRTLHQPSSWVPGTGPGMTMKRGSATLLRRLAQALEELRLDLEIAGADRAGGQRVVVAVGVGHPPAGLG